MICVSAYGTFDRVISVLLLVFNELVDRGGILDSRGAKSHATFTRFDGAGKLLEPAGLETDVLPSCIQSLFDFVGNIDDLRGGDNFVGTLDKAIPHLTVPKAVFDLAILVEVADLAPVQDSALPSE